MNTKLPSQPVNYVVDPEVALPQVQKMIYDQCWRFTRLYPISFEECLSEAYMAFLRACIDYQPARGQKFSSWCYYWVWCKLKDLIMKRSAEPISFMEITDEHMGLAPAGDHRSLLKEIMEEMSSDAREMVALFLDAPQELLSPSQVMRSVRKHLVKERRWNTERFEMTFAEVKASLSGVVASV